MWDKIESEIANMNSSIISHILNISKSPIVIYPYIFNTTKAIIKQLADEFDLHVDGVCYRLLNFPILIDSINKYYSFKIEHHSFGQTETVLHAVRKEQVAQC